MNHPPSLPLVPQPWTPLFSLSHPPSLLLCLSSPPRRHPLCLSASRSPAPSPPLFSFAPTLPLCLSSSIHSLSTSPRRRRYLHQSLLLPFGFDLKDQGFEQIVLDFEGTEMIHPSSPIEGKLLELLEL